MAKRISQEELENLKKEGATVRRSVKQPRRKAVKKPEPEKPVVEVKEDTSGMAAMAATLAYMQQWQEDVSNRLVDELEKFNARTKATVTVTKRNKAGSIVSADIEIV